MLGNEQFSCYERAVFMVTAVRLEDMPLVRDSNRIACKKHALLHAADGLSVKFMPSMVAANVICDWGKF